ncbi:MAG: sigma-54 dependent transcriptional regulator [Polyangiaceae bacterium]
MKGNVLIVDDDESLCTLLAEGLSLQGFTPSWVTSAAAALARAEAEDFDVLVTDLNMRGMSGIELCERLAVLRPDLPTVVITAFGSLDTAVAAIRAGAYDFVTKPFDVEAVAIALDRAVRHHALKVEVRRLRRAVDPSQSFHDLLGQSASMRELYVRLGRLADSDVTVLVTGESGTGKELVARALHQKGRRSNGPFVAINCAAMPENLLESELFGHQKGAFTDARASRVGLFVQSSGGTLFLDEVGDMPAALQTKLLRALEERVVRPVGGDREIPFDCRLVAATHRDLEGMVEDGKFRQDLFYRIAVVQLAMPPLRARGNDVLVLAQHFLERFAATSGRPVRGLTTAAAEKLLEYPWPGNVRELRNAMEHAVALSELDLVGIEALPERVRNHRRSDVLVASQDPSELVPLDEVERRYILRVLEAVGGNKTTAAEVLGVDRKTLYRKLERWNAGEPKG